MTSSIYELYVKYGKQELFNILLSPDDYQPEAIEIAKRILKEKKWTSEYEKTLAEHNSIIEKEELKQQKEYEEKAAYYKKATEFQVQKNSFQVRIGDVAKLEGDLIKNNIDFFREDKHVGVYVDYYPTQTYYFKNKDLKEVDRITKEIGLRAAAYADPQPFLRLEAKILIVVVVIMAILFILLK